MSDFLKSKNNALSNIYILVYEYIYKYRKNINTHTCAFTRTHTHIYIGSIWAGIFHLCNTNKYQRKFLVNYFYLSFNVTVLGGFLVGDWYLKIYFSLFENNWLALAIGKRFCFFGFCYVVYFIFKFLVLCDYCVDIFDMHISTTRMCYQDENLNNMNISSIWISH